MINEETNDAQRLERLSKAHQRNDANFLNGYEPLLPGKRPPEIKYSQPPTAKQSPLGIYIMRNGRVAFANEGLSHITGYSQNEVSSWAQEDFFQLVHPEDRELAIERYDDVLRGDTTSTEFRIVSRSGDVKWIQTLHRPLNPQVNPTVYGMLTDITDRKEAETKLRKSEEKYRLLAENISDVIWTMDFDLNLTYVSPSVENLTGYTTQESKSLNLSDLLAPGSLEIARKTLAEAIGSDHQNRSLGMPDTRTLELQVLHKNGYSVYVEVRARLIHDGYDGKPAGVLGVARNITDRKFAEQTLKDREEMLRATCDSSPGGVLVVNSEGKIVHYNVRFADMWRIPEEFRWATDEHTLLQQVALGQLKNPQAFLAKANELYSSPHDSYDILYFKDGRVFERYSSPLLHEGDIKGRVWSFVDITERKRAEVELRQSRNELEQSLEELRVVNEKLKEMDKVKDDFLSIVSHELRTPLTSIKSFAEILLNYEENTEIQDEFLGIINGECDRLTRLLNDFLDLSKIESGKLAWETSKVDLCEVIESASSSMETLIKESEMSLEIDIDRSMPLVWGDRDRFIQVVTNLLSNAAKFTPGGGKIKIKAQSEGCGPTDSFDMVKVSVMDDGPGLTADERDIAFRKFAQLENRLPHRPRGTGLGLPISREIIEHYGGSLLVESEPGMGSTFYFILPVATDENCPEPYEISSS